MAGIAAILTGIGGAITFWNEKKYQEAVVTLSTSVTAGWGLIRAQDAEKKAGE